MSDNYIVVIPKEPSFVPDEAKQQNAVAYFRSISPDAETIETSLSDGIEFVDAGSNFEKVSCPSCSAEIDVEPWQEWMDQDFDGNGFVFTKHKMRCCGLQYDLNELNYEWPQGFARFQLNAMNPNLGKLSEEQQSRFEEILGCQVRVIYQHY